jgi:hypothetical protein
MDYGTSVLYVLAYPAAQTAKDANIMPRLDIRKSSESFLGGRHLEYRFFLRAQIYVSESA